MAFTTFTKAISRRRADNFTAFVYSDIDSYELPSVRDNRKHTDVGQLFCRARSHIVARKRSVQDLTDFSYFAFPVVWRNLLSVFQVADEWQKNAQGNSENRKRNEKRFSRVKKFPRKCRRRRTGALGADKISRKSRGLPRIRKHAHEILFTR